MKHGPIALITEQFPTVALVGDDMLKAKAVSNIDWSRRAAAPVIFGLRLGSEQGI